MTRRRTAITVLVATIALGAASATVAVRAVKRSAGVVLLGDDGVVRQHRSNDCGLTAMEMVGHLLRAAEWTSSALAREIPLTGQGATLLSLRDFAEHHGVEAAGWQLESRDLHAVPYPAIALLDSHHYVVIERVAADAIVIADPAIGRERMPITTFARRWTGVLLLFGRGAGGARQ